MDVSPKDIYASRYFGGCSVKYTKLHIVAPKKYRYGVQRGGEIVCGVRPYMHDSFDTRLRSCAEGVGLR